MADDQPDVQEAALMFAHAAAGRWIETRFPDMPAYVGRYLAAEITKIVFPFVKVAAHADLADSLWDKGMGDVARAIEQNGREYMAELINEKEDANGRHDAAPVADGPADQ